jgi:hypothetical protein
MLHSYPITFLAIPQTHIGICTYIKRPKPSLAIWLNSVQTKVMAYSLYSQRYEGYQTND